MATVRITNEMRNSVRQRLRDIFKQRKDEVNIEIGALDIADELYQLLMGGKTPLELAEMADKFPHPKDINDRAHPWIHSFSHMRVHQKFETENGEAALIASFKFKDGKSYPMPFGQLTYAGAESPEFALPRAHSMYKKVEELVLYRASLNIELLKLEKELVDGAMQQCTTLRQLLEVWPSALDFMDTSVRERHNRVEAPRKIAKPGITISDEAKSALIKARLTAQQ